MILDILHCSETPLKSIKEKIIEHWSVVTFADWNIPCKKRV